MRRTFVSALACLLPLAAAAAERLQVSLPARPYFTETDVGDAAAPLRITVKNTGDQTTVVTGYALRSIVLGPASPPSGYRDFYLYPDDDECLNQSLRPGQSCSFGAGFSPNGEGLRNAMLAVKTRSNTEFYTVLNGTGKRGTYATDAFNCVAWWANELLPEYFPGQFDAISTVGLRGYCDTGAGVCIATNAPATAADQAQVYYFNAQLATPLLNLGSLAEWQRQAQCSGG